MENLADDDEVGRGNVPSRQRYQMDSRHVNLTETQMEGEGVGQGRC